MICEEGKRKAKKELTQRSRRTQSSHEEEKKTQDPPSKNEYGAPEGEEQPKTHVQNRPVGHPKRKTSGSNLGRGKRIHLGGSRTLAPSDQPSCIQPPAFQEPKPYMQGETR